jgi:15-cis-phytoene synthase
VDALEVGCRAGRPRSVSKKSSFHYSFGILPREQRRGIEAVYSFCRAIDDLADEGSNDPGGSARVLQLYREDVARCFDGTPRLAVNRELQSSIRRFGIRREPLDDLLDGVESDLRATRYETFEDLRDYCYRVASTVGIICLSIFGCRHPRSRDYAIELGIALQLTNILRDLGSDADRGRIYLPRDEIRRFGYSEAELLAGERNQAFLALMTHQAGRARLHFHRAAEALPDADRSRLLAAEVMGAIYRRLLGRIEAGQFRVFGSRIGVPRLTQIAVALRAWATGHVGN